VTQTGLKACTTSVTESWRDPATLGSVTVVLLAVAVIACLAPARRAASIDPMDAEGTNDS